MKSSVVVIVECLLLTTVSLAMIHKTHFSAKVEINFQGLMKKIVTFSVSCSLFLSDNVNHFCPSPCFADMLTFPLPAPLKNNIVLMRAGESFADARHEMQTNPVKKLRQDNALTARGREQVINTANYLESIGFQPSYIWVSNTERAYESAVVLAREIQLGQNRIVPEFSFLDARAVGIFEGRDADTTWKVIHLNDEKDINFSPPKNNDGTPSDSVATVLVRMNQLVSSIESMYSGENVVVLAPDSEILSVLQAALSSEDPDTALPKHAQFAFANGEARVLNPVVKIPLLLASGKTQSEADQSTREVKALLAGSGGGKDLVSKDAIRDWVGLWRLGLTNTPHVQ